MKDSEANCFPLVGQPNLIWQNFSLPALSRLVVVGLSGLLADCASVPQYDTTTEVNLTALQHEIDVELVDWYTDVQSSDLSQRANATYAKSTSFYDKANTNMLSLELRIELWN